MCSLSLRGWWIDGIGIDDFRTSPLCKQDSLFRLLSPEYSQHDIPPHQSGPDNWRFDRTLVVTPFVKTGFAFNGRIARFTPSYRLSMPMHWPSLPGWKLNISNNWKTQSLPASELPWGTTGDLDWFHLKSRLKRKLPQSGRLSYWSFWTTLVLYNGGEVKLMDTKEEGRLRSFAHLGGYG